MDEQPDLDLLLASCRQQITTAEDPDTAKALLSGVLAEAQTIINGLVGAERQEATERVGQWFSDVLEALAARFGGVVGTARLEATLQLSEDDMRAQ